MDSFLKIAGPVTVGLATTVAGLAVTHSEDAFDRMKPFLKGAGKAALRMAADIVTEKLGKGIGPIAPA